MVLVAYAGPESQAAALCAAYCTYRPTFIRCLSINYKPPSSPVLKTLHHTRRASSLACAHTLRLTYTREAAHVGQELSARLGPEANAYIRMSELSQAQVDR